MRRFAGGRGFVVLGAVLASPLLAALPLASRAQTPMTPAQALSNVRQSDLHFSPDGSTLAYVVNSYSWDAKPRVHVLDIASLADRDLTPDGKSERSPQWSPDGRSLAFLSNRGGRTQVYIAPLAGGEPAAVTARKNGVDSFHWSPDGRSLAYLAQDDDAPSTDDGPQVADRETNLSRLWTLDLASKTDHRLGKTGWRIDDFQWRDASHILVVATDRPKLEAFTDAVYDLSVSDGGVQLVDTPPQPFGALAVSPDGKSLALRAPGANGPIERDLYLGPAEGGGLKDVSAPPDLAIAGVRWPRPGAIWVRVLDGFRTRIFRLSPGAAPQAVDLPLPVADFDVAPNGDVAYVGEDFDHLPELYLKPKAGAVRQISHLQQGWEGVRLASTTVFSTTSFDGTQIEAALMTPATPAPGKLPLVLLVHGGPSSNFSANYGWETAWAQLLAAHGYAVLMVNPRGSNGYSEAFVKGNRGDWGGGDYKDLMAVLDAVIAKGGVDPERLGIGGWSYGGEMTMWAITQTRRFKAAVAGAGVYDQQAEFETEAHPQGDEWYFGTPWDHPDVFARNSPATYIAAARTPTLIFDGEQDTANPVGQSKGFYRALKHLGVETQLVLYPGEGHSPRRGSYNVDMFQRLLDWYDSHLKAPP